MMAMHYGDRAGRLFADPKARATDPETSHLAAANMKRGSSELIRLIQVAATPGPVTQFEIARRVMKITGRWDEGTIRSACARAHLTVVDRAGRSPSGGPARRYTFK